MRRYLMVAILSVAVPPVLAATTAQVGRRVESILKLMTVEEKIDLLGGERLFDIDGIPRLGVPTMKTADGPFGVRRYARANVMAGGIALAATWNMQLAGEVGKQMGRDARARGVHFYLAPGVNIYRSPLNGRNFEYLGEDPFLAGRMAVEFVRGVQSQDVAATVKHYLGNNSEFARHTSDSIIDERTLREIYMPAFEASVREANVAAVMDGYNLMNGEHMTQSRYLNVDVLKREWGFPGVVMSDWVATYDTLAAANGGLDIEMPSGQYLNRELLLPLIEAGKVTSATLDDKVRRILRTAVRFGWLDREQLDPAIPVSNPQGRAAALQTAREGMVLLKNENGTLPLDKQRVRTLAIIGPNAFPAVPHGGGSVTVAPFHAVSFMEGLSNHLGTNVDVHYARGIADLRRVANATAFSTTASDGERGVWLETFDNAELAGTPNRRIVRNINQGAPLDLTAFATGELELSGDALQPSKSLSWRWTGYYTPAQTGNHDVFVQFGGFARGVGHRLFIDDKLVADHWRIKSSVVASHRLALEASPHKIVLECRGEAGGFAGSEPFVRLGVAREGTWVDPAAEQMAAKADAVVIAVGYDSATETEDWDRSFSLPPGQDELIRKLAGANRNTIVVVTSGGAVDTTQWLSATPALLQAWYPGQEGGTALAEILFGDVNPSGKLPATFERRWQDNPVHDSYYPAAGTDQVIYKEGVFVGYRGYEQQGTQPLFAFGHGLSYTTFRYHDVAIKPATAAGHLYEVSFSVTNTGSRPGAAVPQVYVSEDNARVARPLKELKGFTKLTLRPGETRNVTVPLNARAFSYYDAKAKRWRADAGTFSILVGSSSAQIEIEAEVKLPRSITSG